jgi:magnesium-protoporphyrin O-methyltransferase
MISCCHTNYRDTFDDQAARDDLENYHRNGPKKNSAPLINALKHLEFSDISMLDIGGGIGSIFFELLSKGVHTISYVDISASSSKAFETELQKSAFNGKSGIFTGDFLDFHMRIPEVDLVTLDKAICCHPDFLSLVGLSAQKAKKWYAYVIPVDSWWVQPFFTLKAILSFSKRGRFVTYIHPVYKIDKILTDQGFEKIYHHQQREWLTAIFRKN